METHTAGLIIIGDEILRGRVTDENTRYLAEKLTAVGIRLRKVVVVPDSVNEIAEEVKTASRIYSIVFTAGGVGPTHDDVTYSAIAKGLDLKLEENKKLLEIYSLLFPGQIEAKRLAKVPNPCEIIYVTSQASKSSAGKTYPVIKAENIYILPGSPSHFSQAVDVIIPQLKGGQIFHTTYIDVHLDELAFVDILDDFAKRWEGKVNIGSYPQSGSESLTRISMEGLDEEALENAEKALRSAIFSRELICSKFFTISHATEIEKSSQNHPHIKKAIDIIQRCYEENADGIFMNFNGGKDCTVVLHLLATVAKLRGAQCPLCLYVSDDPFLEVEEFVDYAKSYYSIKLTRKTGSIRSALKDLLEEYDYLKIGIMGMRHGDPGSDKLKSFTPTDEGWPSMVRVNPILDWNYTQVWEFLINHNVVYCKLYDQGYTSLGKKSTTKKNPLLKDPNNPELYLPAYTLSDGTVERQGRG